ncbi:ng,ng-dimethylarginine dimethylaminohydrolase,putative [Schistosoma mansoni]|nr:ng,ng-dimethylarginine dimethylaminohydrolase,putative [Schistosoma mansoni]|eukprot:XP_018646442.1 ng,ng-dimethylarginine dimethylaminohydrolase,putative [Schistosoma mansoni]
MAFQYEYAVVSQIPRSFEWKPMNVILSV